MRVEVLRNADHRLSAGRIQAFRAGTIVNIPKATAQSLIERGAARAIDPAAKSAPTANQED